VFADPGRYEFFNCEQLAVQRVAGKAREQELKQLMNRAEQGAGGTLVNVIAYKGDYVAVTEELKVIDMILRVKNAQPRRIGAVAPLSDEAAAQTPRADSGVAPGVFRRLPGPAGF
jgi:hypothetical protein